MDILVVLVHLDLLAVAAYLALTELDLLAVKDRQAFLGLTMLRIMAQKVTARQLLLT
jgi:hypothetical protein